MGLNGGLNGAAAPRTLLINAGRSARNNKTIDAATSRPSTLGRTLALAGEKGLLKGRRTLVIRGRMPEGLVAAAKQKTGITSDSKLLEIALANLAVADDYAEWLYSQRGTVDLDLDLEF